MLLILSFLLFCEQQPKSFTYDNILDPNGHFDDKPPIANFTVTPDTGTVNETMFTFNADESYEEENPTASLYHKWDFDGDGIWDTELSKNTIATHTYSNPNKLMKVHLWVQGANDLHTIVTKYIYVNSLPNPVIDWTYNFEDVRTIKFDASQSSDEEDSSGLFYQWDFDRDGKADTEWLPDPYINHSFTNSEFWGVFFG